MASVDFGRYKKLVKAFWDPEPRNDDTSGACIWCLGRHYASQPLSTEKKNPRPVTDSEESLVSNGVESQPNGEQAKAKPNGDSAAEQQARESEADLGWPPEFLDDCESRIWLTYRSHFPPIKKSSDASMTLSVRLRNLGEQGGFTSDTGWGCMIRSGQSLLANALLMLRLGRDWRRGTKKEEERQLLSLFLDEPSAPFSIHRFVEHGASACGKHPGEWFGPSATARCIQALSHEYPLSGLKVYINGDGADVYEDSFFNIAKRSNGEFTPTLILVGIRLGIDRITPVYRDALKALLRLPQSVGIAGGRPSSSHYFFALQGDQFFYLDPHVTRPALQRSSEPTFLSDEDVDSCHTRRLRRIPLRDMDPSMLLAFLIRNEEDWDNWRREIRQTSGKPVVHIAENEPSLHGQGSERPSAVDDVETFDDDDEGDGEIIDHPDK
ncbi:Cysteine protease atg4 [Lecanora helva]